MPTLTRRDDIIEHIKHKHPFHGSNVSGYPIRDNAQVDRGSLRGQWWARLQDDTPVYVVTSYDTPIAWESASGEHVIPSDKYSTTTDKHQNMAAEGMTGDPKRRTSL